jgi:hypothetical protein
MTDVPPSILRRDELHDHETYLIDLHNELDQVLAALDTHDRLLAAGILLGVIDELRERIDEDLITTREEALTQCGALLP